MARQVFYNIMWGKWEQKTGLPHPAHQTLRAKAAKARAGSWIGLDGYREFAMLDLDAKLYIGKRGNITGIGFRSDEVRTMFALEVQFNKYDER